MYCILDVKIFISDAIKTFDTSLIIEGEKLVCHITLYHITHLILCDTDVLYSCIIESFVF